MISEEGRVEFVKAWAKFQGELPTVTKDKKANVGKYKYTYADLASILDTVRPVMTKHGFGYFQSIDHETGNVLTMVTHEGGGTMLTTVPLVWNAQQGAQGLGAGLTYCRRYGLCAALGIATDDDTDADNARKGTQHRGAQAQADAPEEAVWLSEFYQDVKRCRDESVLDDMLASNKAELDAAKLVNPSGYSVFERNLTRIRYACREEAAKQKRPPPKTPEDGEFLPLDERLN